MTELDWHCTVCWIKDGMGQPLLADKRAELCPIHRRRVCEAQATIGERWKCLTCNVLFGMPVRVNEEDFSCSVCGSDNTAYAGEPC